MELRAAEYLLRNLLCVPRQCYNKALQLHLGWVSSGNLGPGEGRGRPALGRACACASGSQSSERTVPELCGFHLRVPRWALAPAAL